MRATYPKLLFDHQEVRDPKEYPKDLRCANLDQLTKDTYHPRLLGSFPPTSG